MQVVCENCGKKTNKRPNQVEKYERHFCNRECYMEFKKKYPYLYMAREKDTAPLRKIKRLAMMRRQVFEKNSIPLKKSKII